MNIYLTIIISITIFFLLWYVKRSMEIAPLAQSPERRAFGCATRILIEGSKTPRSHDLMAARFDGHRSQSLTMDDFLVKNYHQRPNYMKRVVLVIETFKNVENLLVLLRNILGQEIKVDSIVLISSDQTLKKSGLIRDTCILNKVGGLSFLFKESGNDTILVFIFSEGFNAFSNPHFLKKFIETNGIPRVKGIVKIESSNVKVDINKIYSN